MKRLLPFLLLFGLACNFLVPAATSTATLAPTATSRPPTATATAPAPTATAASTSTPPPTLEGKYHLRPSDVTFHPDPQLYSGDVVSLEISAANADPAWQESPVKLYVGSRDSQPLAAVKFGRFGIGGRAQATFTWAWDTAGLEGPQTLVIAIEAEAAPAPLEVLTLTVNLLPASQRPMPEPLAHWAEAESACCLFHYLTGTAAARDIELIRSEADAAFTHVESVLGVHRRKKVSFTLLSRLLGHGGFASDEVALTYVDRNPAGNDLSTVFAHEGTHILDQQIASTKPALLTEGLAVYVAGGHFKPEDLDRRAAALLTLGRYLPLPKLADDFYPAQHEIGYLEGAAFVKYLVDTYGWERFKAFYGSFREAASDARMLDAGLQANFSRSLSETEADWLAHLETLSPSPAQIDDLRLTVALFDTLRRYQTLKDPSAYFLHAWLPSSAEARQRGIVADFVRHPVAPENVALETMLAEAGQALVVGQYAATERLVTAVNHALDSDNLRLDPVAADYLAIATDLSAEGYEAQRIALDGQTATVTAIQSWPKLETLTLHRTATGWFSYRSEFHDSIIFSHK